MSKSSKKLVLFGASSIGEVAVKDYVPKIKDSYDQIFFCDNNKAKANMYFSGLKILSIDEIIEDREVIDIIITSTYWDDIYIQCSEKQFNIIGIYTKQDNTIHKYEELFEVSVNSQDGEELYLKEVYTDLTYKGVYVDIGAHHPLRFSNTAWAYQRGWNGINIEPNPEAIMLFNQLRTRDVNLNCGISDKVESLNYFMFAEAAVNTFCETEFQGNRVPKEICQIPVRTLADIFEEYKIAKIDYMDIDVEGMELQVLKSNDWSKFIPTYILLEQKNMSINQILATEEYLFLHEQGYLPMSKYNRTVIYKKD